MSAAAVIAIRRKRLVCAFREVGATEAARAVTLEQLGQRRSWVFNQMAANRVFIATGDDRYFMDAQAAEEFLAARRRRALVFTGIALLLFFTGRLVNLLWKSWL